jgi:hypothetical protein
LTEGKDIDEIWDFSFQFANSIMDQYEQRQREGIENTLPDSIQEFCDKYAITAKPEEVDSLVVETEHILTRSTDRYIEFFVSKYYQSVFRKWKSRETRQFARM